MADDGAVGAWMRKTQNRDKSRDYDSMTNGYDDEPSFSDTEDFVDDVTDEELLGDLLRREPKETDGIESVIVVDNIPVVGPERLPKLKSVINKIYSKFGNITTEHYPTDDGKTKGYVFLEYTEPACAVEAVKSTNGYKLDKLHTFEVNLFSDFDKYKDIPDEWEEPNLAEYKDHGNLRSWLTDKNYYDQYSVIFEGGEKTAIMLNQHQEPATVQERARWTETYVRWSPQGTYLATFHQRGVALWGGTEFKQIQRYSHLGVHLIDFSPCERFLVTLSTVADTDEDPQAIVIWDVLTGQRKRGFHCETSSHWPIFKWSHDGTYFARMSTDTLSVYASEHFGLTEDSDGKKRSIKVPGIKDFAWSPTDNYVSYWVPEERNNPARVTIMEVPSRRQLCSKNLFTVADCKMHWQKSGDLLCVNVSRYKSKKEGKEGVIFAGMYHNFNVFRVREKQIPVDSIEQKDVVVAFAFEPHGRKFACIHGEAPRIHVSLYEVKTAGSVELVKVFEKCQANCLFWSPNGQFLVLAGLRSMNGVLEFIDTSDMTIMNQAEHFMATDVEWDPSGRYVMTAVSWWGHKVDNAYWLWNFQGTLLHKRPLDRFCQLQWRPRPPTLLSAEKQKEIKKNMKLYYSKFQLVDKLRANKVSKEQIERRQRLSVEFRDWRKKLEAQLAQTRDQRLELRGGDLGDLRRDLVTRSYAGIDTDHVEADEDNFEEETIEFLVNVEEIPITEE